VAVYKHPFVYHQKEDEMIDQIVHKYAPEFVTGHTPSTKYSWVNSII